MKRNTVIAQSPGRINIIGGHTDYNDGFVLPAAIDKKAVFKLSTNGTPSTVNVTSENMGNVHSFDLTNFHPIGNGWENYVMGVVHEIQQLGVTLGGFDGSFGGDVPIGSGMSSSAALECSLAFGLNELFELGLDKWALIKASQLAEHNFVGIKCGIMDQFASVMGKKDQVMLLDCRSLAFEYFPFDLGSYEILLLNSNVSHELASSEYNTRRAECEAGVTLLKEKFPTIVNLRDVTLNQLIESKSILPEHIYRRCHHIVSENDRVLLATQALKGNDFQKLGQLVYQSHDSLQNDFEVSCSELDFLVELTRDKEYVLGSRMMGGGFGGCTINIIEKDKTSDFIDIATEQYRKQTGTDCTPYFVSIEDGAGLV